MGSSGEDPNKGIDASAGSLVWVRRRNGSWWPGKILGPDELPEGCVPTPRSGTPVKLLGRDDASVDWYNLEKSKRVKAFHCGEYDNCIEKVKASASHLSKKGVKYARREDAILHALKLESARLGNELPDSSAATDTQFLDHHNIDESTSVPSEEGEDDVDEDSSSSGDDSDEQDHVDPAKEESEPLKNPNDSEDDGAGAKRMKGLEDLGMGAESPLKRKRSQAAQSNELLKRKNRSRTLTKVLESTAMVTVPVVCDKLSRQTGSSEHVESNDEPKKNDTFVISNNSDSNGTSCENGALLDASAHVDNDDDDDKFRVPESESSQRLFDVHLVAEEKCPAGLSSVIPDASQPTQVSAKAQLSESSHVETLSLGNEDQNECRSSSTSSGTVNTNPIINQTTEKGTTKWQSKGKRNSRPRKFDDEAEFHTPAVKTRQITDIHVDEFLTWSWKNPQRESDSPAPQRLLPYRQSRFTVNPKYDSSDFPLRNHHPAGPALFDVTVEVKSDYRPQRVPYISLMSKSSGRPVVGHPLTIETLPDGSCIDLVNYSSASSELDSKVVAPLPEGSGKRKPRGRPPANPRKSKKNGLLLKKTRKLSTLSGAHRLSRVGKKSVVEKLKGPSVACVPLNVVFSRINAGLNGSGVRKMPSSS